MRKLALAIAFSAFLPAAAMAGPQYGYGGGDDYCPQDAYAGGYNGASYGYVEPATYGYGGYGGYYRRPYYGYGGYYRPRYYGGYGGYGYYRPRYYGGYGGYRGYGYRGGYGRY